MRASRQQMWMAIARAASTRSTCYRLNVGAAVVRDRSILGLGYNGAPSGVAHCTGDQCQHFRPTGCSVVHAETNAINRALEAVDSLAGGELYVTHSPCAQCVARIIATGISKVYYETAYRDPKPVETLTGSEVLVRQLMPSGVTIDIKTGRLIDEE